MEYIAVSLKGIEDIVAKEVKGKKILDGRVFFKNKIKKFRSVNKICRLLKKFKFKDFQDLINKISKIKINFKESFRVECYREGEHDFKSVDVEREVARLMIKKGYNADLKKAKKIVYIEILKNNCLIGILLKDRLCRRDYRIKINNQGINACLAYALLKIANYNKKDILLDPFCKDGVIAIEAYLLNKGKVYAFDSNENNIRNARINAALAKAKINFGCYNINWLSTKFKKNSIKIVSSPIFLSKRRKVDKILKEFFNQAKYIVKKEMVLISPKEELIEFSNGFKIKERREVYVGKAKYFIFKFEKDI